MLQAQDGKDTTGGRTGTKSVAMSLQDMIVSELPAEGNALVMRALGKLQASGAGRMPVAAVLPGGAASAPLTKKPHAEACRRAAMCRAAYAARLTLVQVRSPPPPSLY